MSFTCKVCLEEYDDYFMSAQDEDMCDFCCENIKISYELGLEDR